MASEAPTSHLAGTFYIETNIKFPEGLDSTAENTVIPGWGKSKACQKGYSHSLLNVLIFGANRLSYTGDFEAVTAEVNENLAYWGLKVVGLELLHADANIFTHADVNERGIPCILMAHVRETGEKTSSAIIRASAVAITLHYGMAVGVERAVCS
ncbi:MAG: hypothetical protein Q3972_06445 [Corynebacterium sp.]|nr:hypothetical protein [Corynebacterium sp.]